MRKNNILFIHRSFLRNVSLLSAKFMFSQLQFPHYSAQKSSCFYWEWESILEWERDWAFHEGKCYYFNTNRTSWSDSRRFCRDLGGDLVKIDSREEQEFLVGKMTTWENEFWIGLTDSETEGRWLWVDGSPLNESLSFWNTGEPNDVKTDNSEGEDCVGLDMRGRDGDLKTWNDQSCDIGYRGICEKPAVTGKTSCV
uniref:Collectin-12-like n=1 Tax=Kryptolebias marmoratus TaxID=37003 RepID=A0A3Q2ZSA1_KRYMA